MEILYTCIIKFMDNSHKKCIKTTISIEYSFLDCYFQCEWTSSVTIHRYIDTMYDDTIHRYHT